MDIPSGFGRLAVCCFACAAAALMGLHTTAGQAAISSPVKFQGMCDASAAIALGDQIFLTANDEDNLLRLYDRRGGAPLAQFDIAPLLDLDPKRPETDLEGATRMGDLIFWITSHARNAEGKPRPNRHRLFATRCLFQNGKLDIKIAGRPYANLQADLLAETKFAKYKLADAAQLAPKERGGFNIEGLCSPGAETLLIGLRNPLPGRKALLIPLLNPLEVIKGQKCRFGEAVELDLDGRGIRDIVFRDQKYYLIGGAYDGKDRSQLFLWDGVSTKPEPLLATAFRHLNPEAILFYPGPGKGFQLLSDDGTEQINGVDCKNLEDPMQKSFRAVWVDQ